MLYGGIDPGKLGALALLDQDGRVLELHRMPLVNGAGRAQFDLPALRDVLTSWREKQAFVCVEKQQPLPRNMGGGIANYMRGMSSGFLWMLTALGIPFHVVAPVSWQRRMLEGIAGDTKQRAIVAAARLFPGTDLRRTPRARKLHDGSADALLIAEYGRRVHSPREKNS